MLVAPLLISALTGCYRDEVATFPTDGIAFEAEVRYPNDFCPPFDEEVDPAYEVVAEAPQGWVIDTFSMPVTCPDGEDSSFYLVYPAGASGPMKLAVYFHSGAFDYVFDPEQSNPTGGEHFQRRGGEAESENRLEREWAVERVFATLGMACDRDASEDHNGALPVALAHKNVAMLMPANCWGDLWANHEGFPNQVSEEYFERRGFEAAEYAWTVATAPASVGVSLPITVDPNEVYMIGQGEGGRAVTQLIRGGATPKAAFTDGFGDDIAAYWLNLDAYQARVTGFERIFGTADATRAGALSHGGTLPPRMGYVYSSLDARVARRAHEIIVPRVTIRPNSFVRDTESPVHINTAGEYPLSQEVAAWLVGE